MVQSCTWDFCTKIIVCSKVASGIEYMWSIYLLTPSLFCFSGAVPHFTMVFWGYRLILSQLVQHAGIFPYFWLKNLQMTSGLRIVPDRMFEKCCWIRLAGACVPQIYFLFFHLHLSHMNHLSSLALFGSDKTSGPCWLFLKRLICAAYFWNT
jgi:hypothetical protein